jgi:multicomponent Na+:H+ antiporter subunit B
MNSVILQIAAKYVRWILIFFAVIALYRGHNEPGGGFIGGLLVSLSVMFYSLAYNAEKAKQKLLIQPETNIFLGVLFILLSVLPGLFQKGTFMAGVWTSISLPVLGEIKLGTPLLFDIGVFFAVIGVSVMFFFALKRIGQWK